MSKFLDRNYQINNFKNFRNFHEFNVILKNHKNYENLTYFQEQPQFLEKFLEQSPVKLYSPDKKSKILPEFLKN